MSYSFNRGALSHSVFLSQSIRIEPGQYLTCDRRAAGDEYSAVSVFGGAVADAESADRQLFVALADSDDDIFFVRYLISQLFSVSPQEHQQRRLACAAGLLIQNCEP